MGCAILGAVSAQQGAIKRRRYALFKGLSTGLCGCITSFSSWQLDASKALVYWPSHDLGDDNNGAGAALSGSISTVLTGLSWIYVGIHSRRALPPPVCA